MGEGRKERWAGNLKKLGGGAVEREQGEKKEAGVGSVTEYVQRWSRGL